jgi:hypothetical protein
MDRAQLRSPKILLPNWVGNSGINFSHMERLPGSSQSAEQETERVFLTGKMSDEVFRVPDLPFEIDPHKITDHS